MKTGLISGKLKGKKEIKETKELKLTNGKDKVDYRKGCERSDR